MLVTALAIIDAVLILVLLFTLKRRAGYSISFRPLHRHYWLALVKTSVIHNSLFQGYWVHYVFALRFNGWGKDPVKQGLLDL